MLLLLIVSWTLLNNALANPSEAKCQPGWKLYDKECLRLYNDLLNYKEAEDYCKNKHAYLAIVQDPSKMEFANDLFRNGTNSSNTTNFVWLGFEVENIEQYSATIRYADGSTHTPAPYDMTDTISSYNETCGVLRIEPKEKILKTRFCTNKYSFVCEKKALKEKTDKKQKKIQCRDGWFRYLPDMSCIKVESKRKLSWHDAQAECQQKGGDLFLPIKGEKALIVNILIARKNTHYWVGFDDKDKDGQFNMINGENMTNALPWQRREPNNAHGNEHCGEMKNGLLFDKRCGRKRNFVCESSIAPSP